ncbi:MAG: thioredoxin-disulfide reductase [Erysipelotrichaceae bacterium]|nr:thioredoxin-disulfide reductase [Erysipelotrichaceae bacterium]
MYDVLIIGGGPAGLTAAIYASRADLSVAVIESEAMGGKLSKTYEIENYPGFSKIGGGELADKLLEHAKSFGADIRPGSVVKLTDGKVKEAVLDNGEKIEAKTVILATGTRERHLALPGADDLIGRGISYCAVCDGFFYRKKDVVIIGGGNSALEEALFLSSLVNKLYIVIRRDVFRADATVIEKVRANEKIEIITKHLPESLIIEEGRLKGLEIKNVDTGEKRTIECSGIFPYIGADPNTSFIDLDILDEKGYIIVDRDMATRIEGIYAAGDVTNKDLRQVVTATNDGAIAANAIAAYLRRQ